MPTLDGVNVKRLDHPEGSGVLLDAQEILRSLSSYVEESHPLTGMRLREASFVVDCDLALSDRTLFGLTDDEWRSHNPHEREYPEMPSSEAEWQAHVAFYRLTVSQRDRAWQRIRELESAYLQIAREASDLLGEYAPGAAAMFLQGCRARSVNWLRRNVLVLRGEDPAWPTLSLLIGDWLELWRAGHRRGLLLRFSRFQISASRRYFYVALTDHKRYIDIIFARPRGFNPSGL